MSNNGERLRYVQIAGRIERQISAGTLLPNDRVPSLRAMSKAEGVSVGTVVQAYLHLERRGILRSRPRSGFFVASHGSGRREPRAVSRARTTRPTNVATSVIDAIIESFGRDDLIAFNSAVTTSARRINGRLNGLARAALRRHPENANDLTPVAGLGAMRRSVARRLALAGVDCGPDDVVITNGTMEALTLSLGALCRAGDTVLIESPTYFGILQALERLRLRVVEVPNRPGTGIDVEAVERTVAHAKISAALFQPNFNNPTGALTPDESKRAIVSVLVKAGIPIIEDDIYGDLHFDADRPRPLSAFDESGLVVTCGSVSKTVALGYRVGWAVSPSFASGISRAKFSSSVASPTLQQHVIARYFASGIHDRHITRVREMLAKNVRVFRRAILDEFPEGTRVSLPAGGVVLWVELPADVSGREMFAEAMARRIGIAPGSIFSARGRYENFVRLSAGIEWTDAVASALRTLGRLAGRTGQASPDVS